MIIGKAYGTAYVAMNSKSIGADLVYAWDNAEIGMMDASLAAKIMYADADAAELNEKAAQYRELQNGVASAAARGYVDTVISPADAYENDQKNNFCIHDISRNGCAGDWQHLCGICRR